MNKGLKEGRNPWYDLKLHLKLSYLVSSKAKTLDKKPIWNRLPGQANKIPNKLKLILPTGRKGCSLARFSPDGR